MLFGFMLCYIIFMLCDSILYRIVSYVRDCVLCLAFPVSFFLEGLRSD